MDSRFPEDLLQRIERAGLAAVLVVDEVSHAAPLANALLAGGIEVMELTLRTPGAIDAVRAVRAEVPAMTVGVGTILTPQQVRQVAEAGAAFGVAPGTNRRVLDAAGEVGLPFAPGIATPSDLETALELGCREVKFFPAQPMGGVPYLKSLAAPYAHLGVRFIPLGGLNMKNMADYLREPAVLALGGSWIAPRKQILQQDWSGITAAAAAAVNLVKEVRNGDGR